MTDIPDSYRRWIAVLAAIVAAALLVAGWSLMIDLVRPAPPGEDVAATQPISPDTAQDARRVRAVLFYAMVLVGIFLIGSFAFLRWSRRFRRMVLQKPHDPSPADDVWAMHRLPEGPDEGDSPGSERDDLD